MSTERFNIEMNSIESQKPKITPEDFDEQFVKQTNEVDGHTFEYVKVEPSEIISDQWVVFLGGFGTGPKQYRDEIEDLVRSGRKVFFINPIKGVDMEEVDSNALESFDVAETIKCKTAEVLKALEIAGIERADIVGHSQGAIVGAMLAELRLGLADDLVLNNPAGMHGEDKSLAMIGRTLKGFNEQLVNSGARGAAKILTSLPFKNEMPKSIGYRFSKEVPGIVASNIIPTLQSIKERQDDLADDKKTKITLVTSNKDRTFSPEKIEKEIGFNTDSTKAMEHSLETVVDSYLMYVKEDAGHEALIYDKSGLTAQIVNEKLVNKKRGPKFSTSHNV